ncbi:uncharacterized protein SPPG_03841 [Spizellomyces punctatus DAOM BR117]|uniref:Uncharacterized protein n=1 Tax=Spizellomyces punctatus (strain DAOM BR117) TaxID=645134 RepID=A0A0L0HIM4_SPIPD|nr:uncharacterized protein SPPG_03841 [Spizellomyces punctatus DAOM BR117]KND00725.1 hypothetical protein SPPG_03841 [Spizellomyces punctatus DAOM BR117]|eukprot:XP_016608764.1 hypothetical protein SPPG_03841 [Spizellomyces punctatus DAOM BR117]
MQSATDADEELTAFGDSDKTSEDLRSPRRAQSFKKPRVPVKRRSVRGMRKLQIPPDEDELDYDTDSALISPNAGRFPTATSSSPPAIQRSATIGSLQYLRGVERELEQTRNERRKLENALKESESVANSYAEDAERWKKKYRDADDDLTRLREQQDTQELRIQQLQEMVDVLRRQVTQADKDKAVLRSEANIAVTALSKMKGERSETERQLSTQLSTANAANTALRAELKETESLFQAAKVEYELATRTYETTQRAHLVMIKTLEKELQETRQRTLDHGAIQQLVRRSSLELLKRTDRLHERFESGTASSTTDITDQLLLQLAEQNRALQEEIEMLRATDVALPSENNLNGEGPQDRPPSPIKGVAFMASPPASPGHPPAVTKKGPRIPRRTSSVCELLAVKTAKTARTEDGMKSKMGTLAAELAHPQTPNDGEVERLRQENMALVSYLVATLDSLSKIQ